MFAQEESLEDKLRRQSKLQAQKSSYQAWKCVSFGCSLFAVILLYSKWYEVSTDLRLLILVNEKFQIEPNVSNSIDQFANAHDTTQGNETKRNELFDIHTHQLLRQEVQSFIGEFKGAKSTLSLSWLLVLVYLLSWLLMTLAVNDTQISNDVSLRNILLLSVFGAIDLAASVGFVLVRLITYSVKNNAFVDEVMGTATIQSDSRFASDQLAALTALRLIAMRSCSAYVDIYVSGVVGSLGLLRLYATLRALAYYRRLRSSERPVGLSATLPALLEPPTKAWQSPAPTVSMLPMGVSWGRTAGRPLSQQPISSKRHSRLIESDGGPVPPPRPRSSQGRTMRASTDAAYESEPVRVAPEPPVRSSRAFGTLQAAPSSSYTLLSVHQLDKLSRRMFAAGAASATPAAAPSGGRARPQRVAVARPRLIQRARPREPTALLLNDADLSSSSKTSSSSPSLISTRELDEQHQLRAMSTSNRETGAKLMGVRQTEEFLTRNQLDQKQQQVLLGKYYYA